MRGVFRSTKATADPLLVWVVAAGGDKVEIREGSVWVNGAKAGAANGATGAAWTLHPGQVFGMAPGRNPRSGILDSADVGPLAVDDYLGEIAVVDPLVSRGPIPGLHARWLPPRAGWKP